MPSSLQRKKILRLAYLLLTFNLSYAGLSDDGFPFQVSTTVDHCRAAFATPPRSPLDALSGESLSLLGRELHRFGLSGELSAEIDDIISIVRAGDLIKLVDQHQRERRYLVRGVDYSRILVTEVEATRVRNGFILSNKLHDFISEGGQGELYLNPEISMKNRVAFMEAAFANVGPGAYLVVGVDESLLPNPLYFEAAKQDSLRFINRSATKEELLNLNIGSQVRYYILATCELVNATVIEMDSSHITLGKDSDGSVIKINIDDIDHSEIYLPTLLVDSPPLTPVERVIPTPRGYQSSNASAQIQSNFSGLTDQNSTSSIVVDGDRIAVVFYPRHEASSEDEIYSVAIPTSSREHAVRLIKNIVESYNQRHGSLGRLTVIVKGNRFETGYIEAFYREGALVIIFHRGRGERRYAERLLVILEEDFGLSMEVAFYD